MRLRKVMAALAVLICIAVVAFAAGGGTFQWDGGWGDWNECADWTSIGGKAPACYPSTANDDAIIDAAGTYQIDMITVTIDDLTVGGDNELHVKFNSWPNLRTITCDTFTFVGASQAGDLNQFHVGNKVKLVVGP